MLSTFSTLSADVSEVPWTVIGKVVLAILGVLV